MTSNDEHFQIRPIMTLTLKFKREFKAELSVEKEPELIVLLMRNSSDLHRQEAFFMTLLQVAEIGGHI